MSNKKNENIRFPVFARNINALIDKECGGEKKVFSARTGVHYDSVRRWCNGETLPDGANLLEIKAKYNISIDQLLTGDDSGATLISEWKPETQEACRTVKKIIESSDRTTALALMMNINAFEKSIDRYDDNKSLKKDVDDLKKAVKQLKKTKDLEAGTDTN